MKINYPSGIKQTFSTLKVEKQNKYHNKKTRIDNIEFDSIKESNRYLELKQMQSLGIINSLVEQVKLELQPRFISNGKIIRPINYVADFGYKDTKTGMMIYEDVKSKATQKDKVYCLKIKMLKYKYPNIDFREII